MSLVIERTFSVSKEQSEFIDSQVSAGKYGSASEVVQEGLLALLDRDEEIERWLWEKVIPTYDKMEADPGRLIPADEVFAHFREIHERKLREAASRTGSGSASRAAIRGSSEC